MMLLGSRNFESKRSSSGKGFDLGFGMDRISNLSDDLLLKIFSSLPTKDVVATMLLSKRWRFVWTMVPKLEFDDGFDDDSDDDFEEHSDYENFQKYVDRSLVLNRAPVLEALKFDVGLCCSSEDIATWIRFGMARDVRELEVVHCTDYFVDNASIKLPKTLYTYEKLEVLKLAYTITLDVPVNVCFPSLKALHLMNVVYKTKECYVRLLSGCPVLEELVFDKSENSYSLQSVYVEMPNLQRLSILDRYPVDPVEPDAIRKMVINVPSLKYLNFVNFFGDLFLCENMPEVVEANVYADYESPEKLLRSLPSVKRLYLCLSVSMRQYHIVFCHLVHLELCASSGGWWDLLIWMLESSPKLQVLKICQCNEHGYGAMPIKGPWRGPSSVPECLMFHLHTFKWKNYKIEDEEKRIVAYILNNAKQLKIAAISAGIYYRKPKKEQSKKELVSLPRASSSCQLLLD